MQTLNITRIPLAPVPLVNVICTISWRIVGAQNYILLSNSAAVQPNGNLVIPLQIQNIPDGSSVQVQAVANCGGTPVQVIINPPTTTTTTAAPTTTTTAAPTTTTTTFAPGARFVVPTSGSGSTSFQNETENIVGGSPSAVLTIKVTAYTVTNTGGTITAQGSAVVLNSTFTVNLDASGNGNFPTVITGNPALTGTVIQAIFTIMSASIGVVNPTNNTQQISKAF